MIAVRSIDGELLKTIELADAELLYARGIAFWSGKGKGRHLRLLAEAPWRGGSTTTRAVRAEGTARPDGTCSGYAAGQCLGDPRRIREHRSLP